MVMTSLALAKTSHRPAAVIQHLTGRGYLGYSRSPLALLLRTLAHVALWRCARRHNAWLVAENGDDIAEMIAARAAVAGRTAILPAPASIRRAIRNCPAGQQGAARRLVGRMIRSKGVRRLIEAQRRLRARGTNLEHRPLRRRRLRQPRGHPEGAAGGLGPAARRRLARAHRRRGRRLAHGRRCRRAGARRRRHAARHAGGRRLRPAARRLRRSRLPAVRAARHRGPDRPAGRRRRARRRARTLAADRPLQLSAGAAARRKVVREYTETAVRAKTREIYQAAGGQALRA